MRISLDGQPLRPVREVPMVHTVHRDHLDMFGLDDDGIAPSGQA